MNPLTFKDFLRMLDEDTDTDIANLMLSKQKLVVRKAQATKPLDDQTNNIDKLLMQKEKQKENEAKKAGVATANGAKPSNQTTTPGSAGAQTPGRSSQSGAPQR
jgi:hypothetical protein